MSESYVLNSPVSHSQTSSGLIKKSLVLSYGFASYSIGVFSLVWLILAIGGIAPSSLSPIETNSIVTSVLFNLGLVILFGLQHSIMARKGFKRALNNLLPAAMERSTFLLFTGITVSLLIWAWQPLPGIVWSFENSTAVVAMWSLYGLGWTYLLIATFVTNHFELMGLRQTYLYFTGRPYTKIPFTNKFMYRYSRHPMMLGLLLGMWCLPTMSLTQFVMAAMLTVYVFVGLFFEERDLLTEFGDTYREYKKEIAALIPKIY